MSNLLYDQEELAAARVIAVLIPGALCRISMFEAAQDWRKQGYGLVHYRFPGLDGRPVSPPLSIAGAAQEIAALSARYPDTPLRLVGFSTGGTVAVEAARQMTGDVRVALMASAVPKGGGWSTAWRGFRDILSAIWRARSLLLEPVWLRYYEVLLFGRPVLQDPDLQDRAHRIIAGRRTRIVLPDGGKPRAHMRDLRRWRWAGGAPLPSGCIRLFRGSEDSVFSEDQTACFARQLGDAPVTSYAGHGHLLFLTYPNVFKDIFCFFEARNADPAAPVQT